MRNFALFGWAATWLAYASNLIIFIFHKNIYSGIFAILLFQIMDWIDQSFLTGGRK